MNSSDKIDSTHTKQWEITNEEMRSSPPLTSTEIHSPYADKTIDWKKLLRKSLFAISVVVFGYIFRYITETLLAEHLGAVEYGNFSFMLGIVNILATILLLGVDDALLRFVPEYIENKDWPRLAGYFKNHLRIVITGCLAVLLIGTVLSVFVVFFENSGFKELRTHHHYIFCLWLAPLCSIFIFQAKLLRSFHNLTWSLISYNVLPFLFLNFTVLVILVSGQTFDLSTVWFLYGLILSLVIIVQFIFVQSKCPREIATVLPSHAESIWIRTSLYLLFASLIFWSITYIDLIMLKLLCPKGEQVGIFAAVLTIYGLMFLINLTINVIISPIIIGLVKDHYHERLQKLINSCNLVIVIPALIFALIIGILGKKLLNLFGPGFNAGYYALIIVLASSVFSIISEFSLSLLRYTNHQHILLKINVLTLLLVIGIELLLVPTYGIYGAAIGLLVARALGGLGFLLTAKFHFKIRPLSFI